MNVLHKDSRIPPSGGTEGVASYLAIVREMCATSATEPMLWHIEAAADLGLTWIRLRHDAARLPEQGWKLHVSATLWSAESVLRRTLPILLAEPVQLKVTATPRILAGLNDGTGGSLSQIGKFMTIYPGDDEQAVRLAVALDGATRGLDGPRVPSDRPLRRGSLVHYRYGGFGAMFIQSPIGEIILAVRKPTGELVPDVRSTAYQAPEWAVDPFESAGVVDEIPSPVRIVGDRYAIATPIHHSPRGAVHLALDFVTPSKCVLKQACAGAQPGPDGSDARDRLRREADILEFLAPDDRVPKMIQLIEQGDDLFLAIEDVEGETLEQCIFHEARRGMWLPTARIVDFGVQLAAMLGRMHDSGYVYRDLKPTNVIVAPNGRLRFIDFEMTREIGGTDPFPGAGRFGVGTRGYLSPQQAMGDPPTVADDIYSLGALLFLMATGAEPSRAPHPFALLERPIPLLNAATDPIVIDVIRRCLDPDSSMRFPSMTAFEAALTAPRHQAVAMTPRAPNVAPSDEHEREAREACRNLAGRLGDALCVDARPVPEGAGLAWVSPHKTARGLWSRDLHVGSGGVLMALAELSAALGVPNHRRTLAKGARWLASAPGPAGPPLAGLYVGEAGVSAALLRAGQVLGDDALVDAASLRGIDVATLPFASPDLMNGTAGRLRFHLLLWDDTKRPEHLEHAVAAGQRLIMDSQVVATGQRTWVMPPGYGDFSGTAPIGYGHGAAGIADTLLDLFEVTQDQLYRRVAQEAARWIAGQAVPALEDSTGLAWPMSVGGEPMPAYWCHGAAGIGRFFLHAATLDLLPEATAMWAGAARSTAHGTRWAGPTQCHGLSGSIEFLIDAYQATGDDAHLDDARTLGELLMAFRNEDDGVLRWSADWPWTYGPDYMAGYGGVALALLRLAEPDCRPHGLSRDGFRYPCSATTDHKATAKGGSSPVRPRDRARQHKPEERGLRQ
jgi:Lanthionine synthetase C-like protein/Protein kinase domain